MFVILVYDINQRRVNKIHKICRKYLHPIQKSVFEGNISQKKYQQMQWELRKNIECSQDTVCIYELGSQKYAYKNHLGIFSQNCNVL